MKNLYLSLFIIICVVTSCKKDNKTDKSPAEILTDQQIIANGKAWYEKVVPSNTSTNKNSQAEQSIKSIDSGPGSPDWSNASVARNTSGIDLTIVPYANTTGALLHLNATIGNRRMLLYSDHGNVKQGFWIERDSDRIADQKGFTGNVLLYDLNNNFISGEKYVAGVLTGLIRLDDENKNGNTPQASNKTLSSTKIRVNENPSDILANEPNRFYKIMGGGLICMDWYVRGCVPAVSWCSDWRWDGQSCTEIPSAGAGVGTIPTGGGGGSGGGGGGTGGGGGGGGGNTIPPGTGGGGGAITADPYTEGGSVGYGPDPYYEAIPDIMPVPSNFYVCPTNFNFTSVTTHDLWQEAVVVKLYCNLSYIGDLPEESRAVIVEIPELHFGLPYYNVEGKLVYTANQAGEISADALNQGEFAMRQAFKNNPNMNKEDLARTWVNQAKQEILKLSLGRGRLGLTGSSNAIKAKPLPMPYVPCN